MTLRVATCQFPVSASIAANRDHMLRLLRRAVDRGADLAHFCEGALSGYCGHDFPDFTGFDWGLLREASLAVAARAGELGVWAVFGSAHRRSRGIPPHNSVYVVDAAGALHDRYDKRFCAGDASGTEGELRHFSPGDHPCVFEVGGVRCGVLICHEYRYPELYRELEQAGAAVVLHSFHAGGLGPRAYRRMQRQVGRAHHARNPGTTLPEITMPASMHAAAAANHLHVSASNSAARECCFGSFFVRADGVITGRLPRHRSGVLVSAVDPDRALYDSTLAWRRRAMRGQLHSGRLRRDARSRRRREF